LSDVKVPELLVNVNVLKITVLLWHIFSVDTLVGDPSRTIAKMGGKGGSASLAHTSKRYSSSEQVGSITLPFAILKRGSKPVTLW